MAARLIRCRQGHVFAVAGSNGCPVCGEDQEILPGPQPPPPRRELVALPALISVVVAVLIAASLGTLIPQFWNSFPPPDQGRSPSETETPAGVGEQIAPGEPHQKDGSATSSQPNSDLASKPTTASPTGLPSSAAKPRDAEPKAAAPSQAENSASSGDPSLPAIDYPSINLTQLQKRLQLSEFLMDTMTQIMASESIKANPTPRAAAILAKLAERKVVLASVELANAYFAGRGVTQNDSIGLRYLREAAEEGVGPARLTMAKILSEGRIVLPDSAKARELVTLAARDGTAGASPLARELGLDPSTFGPIGPELNEMATKGDKKVVALANSFIKDKLASGYFALSWYGANFSKDQSLRRDVPDLARKAATLGISNGLQVLALLYRDGALVDQNHYEAYLWYSLAHRFCGSPQWCKDEEKIVTQLARSIDRQEADNFSTAVSQFIAPESDETRAK